jgi:hypothetical protein
MKGELKMNSKLHENLVWIRDNLCNEIACNECPFEKWYGTCTCCGTDCMSDETISDLIVEMIVKAKRTRLTKIM